MENVTKHIWGVRIKLPPEKGATSKWWSNKFYRVVAGTLEDAAHKTRIKHPEAAILAIVHDGELLEQ